MTINHIHQAMSALAAKRSVFYSEADFQFALAWELQILLPKAKIYLERRVNNCYIDIWVEHNGKNFPIELKYKTKSAIIGGIELKNHAAMDYGCYDYLKDICRLENLPNIEKGFAVMLTNDSAYYTDTKRLSAYDNFKIYDGVTRGGRLSWGLTSKGAPFVSGSRDAFTLKKNYTMQWQPYNGGAYDFQYLINEV